MKITKTKNGITVITPEPEKNLTNGQITLSKNESTYLGCEDDPKNWNEISCISNILLDASSIILSNQNGDIYESNIIFDDVLLKNILKISVNSRNYSGFRIENIVGGEYNKMILTYKSDIEIPLKIQFNGNISVVQILDSTEKWKSEEIILSDIPYINTCELYIQPIDKPCVGTLYISELVAIEDN